MDIHYEVQNKGGEWLDEDQGDNGAPVAPAGGVYGLSISLPDANRARVEYQVYTDGKWSAITRDGDKVTSAMADKPITALRVSLAPRNQRHVVYTTYSVDAAGKQDKKDAQDNAVAGNAAAAADTIFKLKMKIDG